MIVSSVVYLLIKITVYPLCKNVGSLSPAKRPFGLELTTFWFWCNIFGHRGALPIFDRWYWKLIMPHFFELTFTFSNNGKVFLFFKIRFFHGIRYIVGYTLRFPPCSPLIHWTNDFISLQLKGVSSLFGMKIIVTKIYMSFKNLVRCRSILMKISH